MKWKRQSQVSGDTDSDVFSVIPQKFWLGGTYSRKFRQCLIFVFCLGDVCLGVEHQEVYLCGPLQPQECGD